MGRSGNALSGVIFMSDRVPKDVAALEQHLSNQMAREYCIDWSKPPTRGPKTERIGSMTVTRPPVTLLSKPHNITVRVQRSPEAGQASTGRRDSSLFADSSTTIVDSSAVGWSVGAQTSYSFGLSVPLPSPLDDFGAGSSINIARMEEKTKYENNGRWTSDGFSVSSTCHKGHYCTFETWTFFARITGICQQSGNLPLQRPCEVDVPIFNRAGEPHTQFVGVHEDLTKPRRNETEEAGAGTKAKDSKAEAPKGDKKPPKALGMVNTLCMLDNYEYWSPSKKMYLDYEKDDWRQDPNEPKPENLENCNDPLPEEAAETGPKCYQNELWAANLPDTPPEEPPEPAEDEQQIPTATGDVVSLNGAQWCTVSFPQSENNQWYNPDTKRWWKDGETDGIEVPDQPEPKELDKCTKKAKENEGERKEEGGEGEGEKVDKEKDGDAQKAGDTQETGDEPDKEAE
ncbi:hypothetical protein CDD83_6025 [Cordyceps sp. RAO-2017]|nr:hypothetical protein CDD83_6025 [Cordyceps sp. RAO-2017]